MYNRKGENRTGIGGATRSCTIQFFYLDIDDSYAYKKIGHLRENRRLICPQHKHCVA